MRPSALPSALLLVLLALLAAPAYGQFSQMKPRRYPVGLATYQKGDTYIKVTYGRPAKPDNVYEVFGSKVVPWRKLWRTGHDGATEITVTQEVTFADDSLTLPAGTYSLFTVPDTASWTVVLNARVNQWGLYKYDPDDNVLSFKAPGFRTIESIESFSIYFEETEEGCDMVLAWDRAACRIGIGIRREDLDGE